MSRSSTTHPQSVEAESNLLNLFGTRLDLPAPADPLEAARQIAWLRGQGQMFLASRAIPSHGLCVDTGAGEGWFALSFAIAFPRWQVVCFEPDAAAAAQLGKTAQRLKLDNVTCIRAALHPDADGTVATPGTGPTALADWARTLSQSLSDAPFQRLAALGGRLAPVTAEAGTEERPDIVQAPAAPLAALTALAPDLVRVEAPGAEAAIAAALRETSTGFVMGELYTPVPAAAFDPSNREVPREYYMTLGSHALRRDYEDNFPDRRIGLDVVVAMYNTKAYIAECIDSVLADENPMIRVLVVDDGSTDGCGDLVAERYADTPRVRLLRKANGGCASARNYGRAHSDATHIAFIDADDRVDPGMFSALLETARYTGAFVVEGEFQFLHMDAEGGERIEPSYEAELHAIPGDQSIGELDFIWLPGADIAVGQPTIWRRIHRRDFLDRKKIWFPEHIRAFDDQIFQLLVSQYCGSLAHVRGHRYHYRQHPAQDIKQGDERHFYSFNMFRAILLRALDEDWPDIRPVVRSLLNTMRWSYGGLRPDLKSIYQEAASEFVAVLEKTYGYHIPPHALRETGIDGLDFLVERRLRDMQATPVNYGVMRLENWRWQPELIRMMQKTQAG